MTSKDEINGIVRRFSDRMIQELPENTLVVALAEQEADDASQEESIVALPQQWQLLFEPDFKDVKSEEETLLDPSSKTLARAWLKYQKHLPKDQRSKKGNVPVNLGEVVQAVGIVQRHWEKKQTLKGGKVKSMFLGLCSSLNDYKDLFAMIPNNDKYISLLTGSLSTIVKASVNHEKLCQGVSEGLDSIGMDISYWRRQLDEHQSNEYMKRYVAKLYVIVFELFIDILSFYSSTWERFKLSFDQKAFEKIIKTRKDQMKELSTRLNDEARLSTEARIISNEETLKRLGNQICSLIANEFQAQAAAQDVRLGKTIQRALRDAARSNMYEKMNTNLPQSPTQLRLEYIGDLEPSNISFHTYSKAEISQSSRELRYFHQGRLVDELRQTAYDLSLNIDVFSRIHKWCIDNQSQALWICGPAQVEIPSKYTIASAYLHFTAQKSEVPVISYFCKRHETTIERKSNVLDMLLGLISQLIHILPSVTISTTANFSAKRFEDLLGLQSSATDALNLFRELLPFAPSPLLCIIDALQFLTSNSAEDLTALQSTIGLLSELQPQENVVKAFFTTDGFVPVLERLKEDQRINTLDFEPEKDIGSSADSEKLVLLRLV